jgi:hypothetical protein
MPVPGTIVQVLYVYGGSNILLKRHAIMTHNVQRRKLTPSFSRVGETGTCTYTVHVLVLVRVKVLVPQSRNTAKVIRTFCIPPANNNIIYLSVEGTVPPRLYEQQIETR